MSRSISLVLPICNAEKTLAEHLQHLFEILNDLTDQFEVLLVDQGSTDHTIDVAQDLAIQYPQVRFARREAFDRDVDSMDRTLEQTTGDIVFVHTEHTGVRFSTLRQLWEMNELDGGIGSMRARTQHQPRLFAREVMEPSCTEIGGLKMICRTHFVPESE